jgi:hypothetical protein
MRFGKLVLPFLFFPVILFSFRPNTVLAVNPILRLQSGSSQVEESSQIEVEVYLDPLNQPTVGADIILNYDPSFWETQEIKCGTLYPSCPAKIFDNFRGVIKLAGSANYSQYNNGYLADQRILAKIRLLAKKSGKTTISFVWKKEATNETNVVSPEKEDLLTNQPQGLEIEIKPKASSQDSSPTATPEYSSTATSNTISSAPPSFSTESPLLNTLKEGAEKVKEVFSSQSTELISPLLEENNASPQVLGVQEPSACATSCSSTIIFLGVIDFLLLLTILLMWFRHRDTQKAALIRIPNRFK